MLRLFTLFTALFSFILLKAQIYEGRDAHQRLAGSQMLRMDPETGKVQYAWLSDRMQVGESGIITYLENIYKLKTPYKLELLRKEKDEIGFEHFRLTLTYRGIPVLGAMLIAHVRNGRLESFNGEVFDVQGPSAAALNEQVCLQHALDSIGAKVYMWQVPSEEEVIREIRQDRNATWFPKGELVYCPANLEFKKSKAILAYKFNIQASEPRSAENIYVSAVTGQVIARENLLHTTDVPGKATTKYSGSQKIITDSTSTVNFRLRENTNGGGVYTYNLKRGTNYGLAVDFTDSNNVWNNVNANFDEIATDAHWGAEVTYDYFKTRHGRSSYNNSNARIYSYVHYATAYDNAFWDGLRMTYGDGNAFKPLTSLDVCGHEITHAVTTYSAGLIYSYESGQLNESFSDIFGNAIERYGKPANYSWIIGEEITNDGTGLRNMSNPKLKGNPRCYKSTYWYYGSGDYGGVHYNSGVQNWWFYLISEGGSGTNDVSNSYKVDSLGILSAEKIAYRNLTVYLTPSSQYADARFYSIRAAADLFGSCSREVVAVTNAWYACNVGNKYDSGYVKSAFIADTMVCNTSKQVKFLNLSSNYSASLWDFGDGTKSTLANPSHVYSTYGKYTINLLVTSCHKNNKDSLVKTAYVVIDSTLDICQAVILPSGGSDSTHACKTFVYDEGGEDYYSNLKTTLYRLSAPGADSIRIKFLDFDYEFGYDSLYIYRGKMPGGALIGAYTGSSLPFGGLTAAFKTSVLTLKHVADPGVTGRGFKMFYTAVKKPVDITAFADTTICLGNSVLLHAKGTGGYKGDYLFQWKNLIYNDSVVVAPKAQTVYQAFLTDVCTKSRDSAQVTVKVREKLDITLNPDSTICQGQSIQLKTMVKGGKNTSYTYTWDHGLGNAASHTVSPLVTTTYRVILSDNCTPVSDTAFITITVKGPLTVKLNTTDTFICYNKTVSMSASGSGGNSATYAYSWNNGLGTGSSKTTSLNAGSWMKVTLSDACTVKPVSDSVWIKVRPELSVKLGKDTTLCYGNGIGFTAAPQGGDTSTYNFTWNQGLSPKSSQTVTPQTKTTYVVIVRDLCSDEAMDSLTVDVLPALKITASKDTTVCAGRSAFMSVSGSGGKTAAYKYTWDQGLPGTGSHTVTPAITTLYRVILSDACSFVPDTAYVKVNVLSPLEIELLTTDTLICYNKSSKLTTSVRGGQVQAYQIVWNNGLGVGSDKTISLQDNTWITATLTDGCTVQAASDSIFIMVRKPLSLELGNDSLICKGSGILIGGLVSGGDASAYSYNWTQGLSPAASHTVLPVVKTTYILTLKDNCSDDVTDSISVDVMPELKISGLKDTVICHGGRADLTPVVSGGIVPQYTFSWNQGLSTVKDQAVQPAATTIYHFELSDNCSVPAATADVKVTVRERLEADVKLSSPEICAGDSALVSISLKGGVPSGYQWTLNGISYASADVYISPAITSPFNLKFQDQCSLDGDTTFSLVVNKLPVADFTADRNIVCTGQRVQFVNQSSGAGTYEWMFGPTDISKQAAPAYKYLTAGTFPVTLKAISPENCAASLTKADYITVVDMPVSNFIPDPVTVNYDHPEVSFQNASSAYTSFTWYFGDGREESTKSDPIHMYGDTGHFNVMLVTRNSIGCSDTATHRITVNDIYRMFLPTAISVNEDGVNDELKIAGRGISTYNVKIFNRWGEMVYNGNESGKAFDGKDKDGKSLPKGSYMLSAEIYDQEGQPHYVRQVLQIL